MRTVVLLQTHILTGPVLRFFEDLRLGGDRYDARVLMHLPPQKPKPAGLERLPHHFVTTPEIRDPSYRAKVDGENWSVWRGGHTDLIGLHFFRTHPEYDRYWFVEYDVRFSGCWADFFAHFEMSQADFLSTTIRRSSSHPEWMHWPTLRVPDQIPSLGAADRLCSFIPIVRVTRQALQAIDRAYREGWGGHCEATWPTIVHRAGLKVEDLGGDGEFVPPENRNRFYTNTPRHEDHAPGSMVFRPARVSAGSQPNLLWHPVKPLSNKLREDARHAWLITRRLASGHGVEL